MRREWWGLTSKPAAGKWAIPLMLGELAVFLDYGHWHTGVLLNWPILRGLGLALYVVAAAWQMWTDVYLARFFGSERPPREPLSEGPFRYVRHPRYAAAMLAKAALALIFASLVCWLLWVAWTFVLVRTVEAEELHLRRRFGTKYENYAHGTARLLPRIY
jgi:protein-S-isoprenylcysteine O-methyltransferase Ste14